MMSVDIKFFKEITCTIPLPHMPILGSSNSMVNKAIISKIPTNGDTVI